MFPQLETTWRIEGPAETNMELMRELAKQKSFEVLMDEESQVSFICRIRDLPSIFHMGKFGKIICKLKQVAPHRCYLTIQFKTMSYSIVIFNSLIALGLALAAYINREYFFLLLIPIAYALGTRFAYSARWVERHSVLRFFKDKLFVIDNSTAS